MLPVAILAVLAVCVLRAVVLSFHWALIHDAITMQYIAAMMLQGVLPYRDIFDMNFPLTYWIHGVGIWLLGKSDIATRSYDLLWCYFGAFSIAACIWRKSRVIACLAGMMFALLHFSNGYMNQLQRDFFMVPILVGGIYFSLGNHPLRAGLCIGAACAIKPVAAVFALGMLFAFPRKQMLEYVVALAVLPTLSFAWMLQAGIFPQFWDIWWHFTLPIFATSAFENTFPFNRTIPFLAAAALIFHATCWQRKIFQRESLLLLVGLCYGMLHYYLQQKGYGQHLYPFWAFLCLSVGMNLAHIAARFPRLLWPVLSSVLALWLLLSPAQLLWKPVRFFTTTPLIAGSQRLDQFLMNSGVIRNNTMQVQVMEDIYGMVWRVAYLHNWKPVSRFLYPFIFYADKGNDTMRGYRQEFVRTMLVSPPQLIILSGSTWPQYKRFVYPRFEEENDLRFLLRNHYVPMGENKGIKIWSRKY